ncbi:hypothetical protein FA592_03580 [Sulfurospirillum diekertiae]|uniref:Uncharacterized protein n=1 Tax=Sulfurospirillum diekertiae TaxID=1854492 RepID=A0A6G9VPB5_9BACT|nr:hypothetical protein [Sulfurospirillum diekertiae]QIR75356.1 hypothetical protein FA584_03675 [Sulfurospirillum diekertiae]QIR78005.1 hypothetical protein FA592_03580 [Sulfurospirillum diekertiae]
MKFIKRIKELEEPKEARFEKLQAVFSRTEEKRISIKSHKESLNVGIQGIRTPSQKGGVVVGGMSIFLKRNYEIAGKMNADGKRSSKKSIGSHGSASLNYMNNHGNDDIKNDTDLSNIYDESGERMTREEFEDFRKELQNDGLNASSRNVISTGQILSRDEYVGLIKYSMDTFKDLTDKDFGYKFAVHTDHEIPHAHVFIHSEDGRDVMMNKEQMHLLKEIVGDKTESIFQEKEIEKNIEKADERAIQGGLEC